MNNETTLEILHDWQGRFSFALANYFWIAPSGKRVCVVREFDLFDSKIHSKFKNLETLSRFNFERVQFWADQLKLVQGARYPSDQIAASEAFGKMIHELLWNEKDENELLNFFIASYELLDAELMIEWIKTLDFEAFVLLAYRSSLVLMLELVFGSRNFEAALAKAKAYLELCSANSKGMGEFNFLEAMKHGECSKEYLDQLIFKNLSSDLAGRWNELSRSEIFFYSLNLLQFPTKYPTNSQSLREHLVNSLEMSGLPSAEAFVASFEGQWVREANVS